MNVKTLPALVVFLMVDAVEQFDSNKSLRITRQSAEVHKSLVREWQPDVNQDPEAEDLFIQLITFDKIWSGGGKRESSEGFSQSDAVSPQGLGHIFPAFRSIFDVLSFDFPSSRESGRERSRLSLSRHHLRFMQYVNEVQPDSFRRPYLIQISSKYCPVCTRIQPVWRETVLELESLGIGFGAVDFGDKWKLANHLGAKHIPSIVGVINGTVSVFQHAVEKRHLMQFVEDLLPQTLVEKVTDHNSVEFLESWHQLNKPRVVLFDQRSSIPLLYKLTAFAHKDYVRFGYVDKSLSAADNLLRRFNINTHASTMLVFKEDTEKPAGILQVTVMKKQIVEEFIYNNRFLFAPRLISQKQFEELCPVRELHQSGTFCALLFTEEEYFTAENEAFLALASANPHGGVRFAYASWHHHRRLCEALPRNGDCSSQVVIVERLSAAGKILYKPVLEGWSGSQEKREELEEQLNRLQEDPPVLELDTVLTQLDEEAFAEEDIRNVMIYLQASFMALLVMLLKDFCFSMIKANKRGGEWDQDRNNSLRQASDRLHREIMMVYFLKVGLFVLLAWKVLVYLLAAGLSSSKTKAPEGGEWEEPDQLSLHFTSGPPLTGSTLDRATGGPVAAWSERVHHDAVLMGILVVTLVIVIVAKLLNYLLAAGLRFNR